MVLRKFSELRKQRLFRFLIIALMLTLSFPSLLGSHLKVSAVDTGNAPQIGGPLVPTTPFSIDREAHGKNDTGNYARVVIYTWGIDPTVEQDPNNDYFVILITATTQAASGWCISNDTSLGGTVFTRLAQSLDLRVLPIPFQGTRFSSRDQPENRR